MYRRALTLRCAEAEAKRDRRKRDGPGKRGLRHGWRGGSLGRLGLRRRGLGNRGRLHGYGRSGRRRRGVEQGFVVSDHADFPGLLAAVEASRARRVLVTHGFSDVLARFLRERGLDAEPLATRLTGEAPPDAAASDADALADDMADEAEPEAGEDAP